MKIAKEQIRKLNRILYEASILGLRFSVEKRKFAIGLYPVALDADGKAPINNHVLFVLSGVRRAAAAYRLGRWDNKSAEVVTFSPDEIYEKTKPFYKQATYLEEAIDGPYQQFNHWNRKLSFDLSLPDWENAGHTLDVALSLEGNEARHIDVRIWFDDIAITNFNFMPLELAMLAAQSERAWTAVNTGDPYMKERFGIVSLGLDKQKRELLNDPRLTNQASYLKGVMLTWKAWSQRKPDDDHDHCEFCWAKFGTKRLGADVLQEGWATKDNKHWICDACYKDYKNMFEW